MVQDRQRRQGGLLGVTGNSAKAPKTNQLASVVKKPISIRELDELLEEARNSCAVIFFTSSTCPPCKKIYPHYTELATQEANNAIFIKIDVTKAFDIGTKYSITATPTFMTFLHGEQENRWSGAELSTLRGNVRMLIEMAWPPHPHQPLHLPKLRNAHRKAVIYDKQPPLEKLKSKMGPSAHDPAVEGVLHFVSARTTKGAAEATLPDLDAFSWFLRSAPSKLPLEIMFAVVDLLRVALVDPRFSGYYAEEKDHKTIAPLLSYVNSLPHCPYPLRLVTLQTVCNLFSSPLYTEHVLGCPTLTSPIVQLITTSLLEDKHHNVRIAASSLSFNIAAANGRTRAEEHREGLPESDQVELAASLLEAISVEEDSQEALTGLLLALGHLVYCAPKNGELVDLLKSMDAQGTVLAKKKVFPKEALVREVGEELLGKGI